MTTLATMKARIADEMMRSDLTSQIATAISDAIKHYQRKRFYFNETDSLAFSTVSSQSEYAASANALIPSLLAIDWITVDADEFLRRMTNEEWRDLTSTSSGGEPYAFAYFEQKIKLYPVPTAVHAMRVQGHYKLAEPASDDEASSPWMIEAEELIRHRSKSILWRDVLYDYEKAAVCAAAEQEALVSLNGMSNVKSGTGRITPTQF